ncbi:MAG: hypothetical protein FWE38_02005 [Firmicutes bacterium]|nr:hypothetical protein [Bacillota bacterium]
MGIWFWIGLAVALAYIAFIVALVVMGKFKTVFMGSRIISVKIALEVFGLALMVLGIILFLAFGTESYGLASTLLYTGIMCAIPAGLYLLIYFWYKMMEKDDALATKGGIVVVGEDIDPVLAQQLAEEEMFAAQMAQMQNTEPTEEITEHIEIIPVIEPVVEEEEETPFEQPNLEETVEESTGLEQIFDAFGDEKTSNPFDNLPPAVVEEKPVTEDLYEQPEEEPAYEEATYEESTYKEVAAESEKTTEHVDDAGDTYYLDEMGHAYYLDDNGTAYYKAEDGTAYYLDENGHAYYLDEDGNPYFKAEDGTAYYIDENGHAYYLDEEKKKYYKDENGRAFYIDADGNAYYADEVAAVTEQEQPADGQAELAALVMNQLHAQPQPTGESIRSTIIVNTADTNPFGVPLVDEQFDDEVERLKEEQARQIAEMEAQMEADLAEQRRLAEEEEQRKAIELAATLERERIERERIAAEEEMRIREEAEAERLAALAEQQAEQARREAEEAALAAEVERLATEMEESARIAREEMEAEARALREEQERRTAELLARMEAKERQQPEIISSPPGWGSYETLVIAPQPARHTGNLTDAEVEQLKRMIEREEAERLAALEEARRNAVLAMEQGLRERAEAEAEVAMMMAEAERARRAAEEADSVMVAAEEVCAERAVAEAEAALLAVKKAEAALEAAEAEAAQIAAMEIRASRVAASEAEVARAAAQEAEEARIAAEDAQIARITAEAEAAKVAAEAEKAKEVARIAAAKAEAALIAAEAEVAKEAAEAAAEAARRALEEAEAQRAREVEKAREAARQALMSAHEARVALAETEADTKRAIELKQERLNERLQSIRAGSGFVSLVPGKATVMPHTPFIKEPTAIEEELTEEELRAAALSLVRTLDRDAVEIETVDAVDTTEEDDEDEGHTAPIYEEDIDDDVHEADTSSATDKKAVDAHDEEIRQAGLALLALQQQGVGVDPEELERALARVHELENEKLRKAELAKKRRQAEKEKRKKVLSRANVEKHIHRYFLTLSACFLMDRDDYKDRFGISPYNRIIVVPPTEEGGRETVSHQMSATPDKLYRFAETLIDVDRFFKHPALFPTFRDMVFENTSLVRMSEKLHLLYLQSYRRDFVKDYRYREDFENMLILVSNHFIVREFNFRKVFRRAPQDWEKLTDPGVLDYLKSGQLQATFEEYFPHWADLGFANIAQAMVACFIDSQKEELTTARLVSKMLKETPRAAKQLDRLTAKRASKRKAPEETEPTPAPAAITEVGVEQPPEKPKRGRPKKTA